MANKCKYFPTVHLACYALLDKDLADPERRHVNICINQGMEKGFVDEKNSEILGHISRNNGIDDWGWPSQKK